MVSDVSERMVTEIVNGLIDDFTEKQLEKIKNRIWIVISNKTITQNTNDIVEYEESKNTKLLKEFYCSKKLEGCSKKSLYQYVNHNKKFLEWANMDVKMITTKHVRAYLAYYQMQREQVLGKPLSNTTIKNTIRYLNTFYNWLEDEEYITKNPVRKMKSTKCEKLIKKPFTEEEIARIKDSCDNQRDAALVEFLNCSGCRVSEVSNLNIKDIEFDKGKCIVYGKGSKQRYVYLSDTCLYQLKKYISKARTDSKDIDAPLFCSLNRKHTRMSKETIENTIRNIGIKSSVLNTHPHRFRRSLACRLIRRGVPIQEVQKILGHEKIDTTMLYVSYIDDFSVEYNQKRYAN